MWRIESSGQHIDVAEVLELSFLEPREGFVPLRGRGLSSDEAAANAMFALQCLDDVLSVLDTGRTAAGQPWMALEWLTGEPLTQHCVAAHRLPADVVVGLGQRLASALGHAHLRGVIHRDIKPDNLMFDAAAAQLKIADFGVARAEDSGATQTGMVLGTPAYMAPEQLAGAPASPAGDLYSLGAVLFELLTSRRPVEASSLGEWLRRISQEPATPLRSLRPDLPAVLGEVVDQMLEREPARRPPLAEDVALALERCQQALVTHC